MFNHIAKYEEECLKYNTQLRIFDKIWGVGNVMKCGLRCLTHYYYTQVHLSSQLKLKLRKKGDLKLQHLCQIKSDIQTPSQLWFTLFKLDELLMSLRKLFEKACASEFLRDIGWALFDVKSKNNERCIKLHLLHWMYILSKIKTIPGILVNLIVKVDGKYTFFVEN